MSATASDGRSAHLTSRWHALTLELRGEISDTSDVERSVFIGDMVYAISQTSVQVSSLDDLTTPVAQAELPAPDGYRWWTLPSWPIWRPYWGWPGWGWGSGWGWGAGWVWVPGWGWVWR